MIKKRLMVLSATLTACLLPNAHAWDGAVSGVVARIDMTVGVGGGAGNYDVRVSLSGYPALCTGGSSWAYINSMEANYNAVTAALLSAKATGGNVLLYTVKDDANYCRIGYVALL